MILRISKKLTEEKVYHKLDKNLIKTRKSITKIPPLNKDIVYLIGVIAGDGTLKRYKRNRGGNHHRFQITSNSPDFLNYINKLLKENFLIEGQIYKDKRKNNTYYLNTTNTSVFCYFEMFEAKYDKNNRLPEICKDEEYFYQYLGGLIDTDGSVDSSKKRVQLKLKNKKVIEEIHSRIKEANPNPVKINYTNNIPFYYIRFDNIFPLRLKNSNVFKTNKITNSNACIAQ